MSCVDKVLFILSFFYGGEFRFEIFLHQQRQKKLYSFQFNVFSWGEKVTGRGDFVVTVHLFFICSVVFLGNISLSFIF